MKYTEEQIKEFANNQYNKKSIEHRNLKQAYTEGFKKAIELVSSSNVIPDVVFSEAELKAKLEEQKEEIRQWLIGMDFEGLAESL